MSILAALLTDFNRPLALDWMEPSPLQYGQVLVRVIASGICGAQLSEIRGEKNPDMPLPRLIGHEGIGVVETIGYGVKRVKIGDRVCMHWRKGEGIECDPPTYGKNFGMYCPSRFAMTGGQVVTFATHSICSENRLTAVLGDAPDELVMLLGCSLSTALGVVENQANVKIGESVLIIGCGGLGLNLILAAKIRGAGNIFVIDIHPEKEALAMAMGATAFFGPKHDAFPLWIPRPSETCDVIIDTSGDSEVIAFTLEYCLAPSGRFIMVGQPKPGTSITIENARHLFDGAGKTIMATQGGRFSPSVDIPRYIQAWRAGRLNLDGIISHRLPLSEINAGLDLVRAGHAGRVLIDCAK